MIYSKMVKKVFVLISVASLLCFIYGILFTVLEVEENSCRMTYMFEYPQFVRIHFNENKKFERYGLYAYSEGYLTQKARSMVFTGAPVIFVPGNSGSYKQARSLASVAIRKGIDNHWDQHLDYFSIDFNEEYSGLFGGYLENQKEFLKACIKVVLSLYRSLPNAPRQVVLIGHSMGGKIAQSIITEKDYSKYVNTVISIAGAMDRPVVNLDVYFESFYREVDKRLLENRSIFVNNSTNYCRSKGIGLNTSTTNKTLDRPLLVTIGGGSRDILVHTGLTHSKFSDIHAITTSIPNVWLSTDHLCSVWCLQLVLVINRFLYSIIAQSKSKHNYKSAQYFIEDKSTKLTKAHHFFVKSYPNYQYKEINLIPNSDKMGDWVEDSRRVYSKHFENGINDTLVQMIRLVDSPQYKMLYADVSKIDTDDWVYACAAIEVSRDMRFCSKATSLQHFGSKLPSVRNKRRFILLDLHKIKRANSSWTHVLLRLQPTREKISLNVDIFDPADRSVHINMPQWYSFSEQIALEDTILGSSFYNFSIFGLHESHQSLAFKIKTRSCSRPKYEVVAQVCVPWNRGCDRSQYFTEKKNDVLYVYTSTSKPSNYNTTENPVLVNLHLDPNCRYHISYQNSFGSTMSRINMQYFHWIPAHLTAILFLSLKYQISLTPKGMKFKCGKLHSALLNSSSFFIITATRIFAKFVLAIESLPKPDSLNQSTLISVIIHGTSLAILLLLTTGIWLAITLYGNVAHSLLLKLTKLPIPTISSVMIPIVEKIPITAGVLLVSIVLVSCGGIGMICGCCIYFILITKQYEDYLEEFVHNTAKLIAKKLFGEFSSRFLKRFKKEESKSDETENTEQIENAITAADDNNSEHSIETTSEDIEEVESIQEGVEHADTNEETISDQAVALKDEENEIEDNKDKEKEKRENEELDRLLKEALQKQNESQEEKNKQEALERKEYNSIHESISSINFHMTMFLLYFIITILNFPSTLSWAKNFKFAPTLLPDPSLIPAAIIILCGSILWQFSTPRNVYGYQFISSVLYICAAICVLFCQDSVYRLNGVISAVFLLITIHQIFAPKKPEEDDEDNTENGLKNKVEKLRELLSVNNAEQ